MLEDADIRPLPLGERRKQLAKLLRKAKPGIRLSEHIAEEWATRLCPRLPARPGGHRVKDGGRPLPVRPAQVLD